MDKIISKEISKTYGDFKALNKLNLSIPDKSIYGILGPNGAGKTTFLRILTQIIYADSGQITINGEKMSPAHARLFGYLPEERGLYKKMKVGEQLLYLGQLKGMSKQDAVREIKNWAEKFDLTSWLHKKVEDLSKGMQQKVQFISTVVHKPEVIILDEPFSGFDPINANMIKNEIFELREAGSTIIFSTHRMESVEELCDHIALINKSNKVLEGPKHKIKEEHKEGKFELLYTGSLASDTSYRILETSQTENSLNKAIIKSVNGITPNELIKNLLNSIEVHEFREQIPSMNEIFISRVGHDNLDKEI